ncbi:MAG: pilus assembly protein [Bryobacterales bacterium]
MVEFALTFTLFLVVAIGIFEFSRLIWSTAVLSHAAKEGARYAMMHGSHNPTKAGGTPTADVKTIVDANAIGIPSEAVDVSVTWTPNNEPGSSVQVDVKYNFRFIASALISTPSQLELERHSQMIVVN